MMCTLHPALVAGGQEGTGFQLACVVLAEM